VSLIAWALKIYFPVSLQFYIEAAISSQIKDMQNAKITKLTKSIRK
jgi:hypothetical protein